MARLAGTTTRNIRVYRDRGLLHPPLRVGRIALFNDTHLTRLRLITSMLDRGYNIAHVHEMLSAWEQGKDLGDMLGLESAIAGSWATEKPERMSGRRRQAAGRRRRGLRPDGRPRRHHGSTDDGDATIVRPKLIEAFNEIRQYGVGTDKLIDIHEQIAPLIDADQRAIWCRQASSTSSHRIKPGAALPAGYRSGRTDHDAGAIPHPGRRRRCSATLAFSIESTIESARRSDPRSTSSTRKPSETERLSRDHSHSMVPGGLLVTSSTTRLTSGTSLVIRVEIRSSTS